MTTQKPLRLWPAVVIAIVELLVMFGAPVVAPDAGPIGMLGGVVGAWPSSCGGYFSGRRRHPQACRWVRPSGATTGAPNMTSNSTMAMTTAGHSRSGFCVVISGPTDLRCADADDAKKGFSDADTPQPKQHDHDRHEHRNREKSGDADRLRDPAWRAKEE